MKSVLLCSATLLAAASLMAADKDDATSAAKKLADADNYSWTQNVDGGQFNTSSKGKTQKDGLVWLESTFNDNTTQSFKKGTKAVTKGDDGWTAVDLTATPQRGGGGGGGGGGRCGGFGAFAFRNFKSPADQVTDLISKTKDLTKAGDTYAGDLTEDGAKALMAFGGRRGGGGGAGGAAPEISGAKGSVKVWITDGSITKYQFKVAGSMSFNGNDMDIDRTTTVEIKDVGTTKIEVPDDAKSKL